ncbi:MAG: hypothetical protein N2109_13475 [Fimbriimonadales bacterium]|nr:hypothetical protein [Fimbriimonadales bacterium]
MTISTPFWLYWLDIARAQLEEALRCREEAARVQAVGGQYGEALTGETRAAMVAAVASAACIESFAKTVATWAGDDSAFRGPAARAAFEILARSFAIEQAALEERLRRLFDDRNSAIHGGETSGESAPHPPGVATGPGNAFFTVERAAGAIRLAVELLEGCVAGAEGDDVSSRLAGRLRAHAPGIGGRVAEIWEAVRRAETWRTRRGASEC